MTNRCAVPVLRTDVVHLLLTSALATAASVRAGDRRVHRHPTAASTRRRRRALAARRASDLGGLLDRARGVLGASSVASCAAVLALPQDPSLVVAPRLDRRRACAPVRSWHRCRRSRSCPLFVLGVRPIQFGAFAAVQGILAVLLHANVRWRLRPLGRIVSTTEFHHWHHSLGDDARDANYAAFLPIFDVIFGTYHMPRRRPPRALRRVGPRAARLVGAAQGPVPQALDGAHEGPRFLRRPPRALLKATMQPMVIRGLRRR